MLFGGGMSGMITIEAGQALNAIRNTKNALTSLGNTKINTNYSGALSQLKQLSKEAATAGKSSVALGNNIAALAGKRVSGVLAPVAQEARQAEQAVQSLSQQIDDLSIGFLLAGGAMATIGKPLMAATIGSIKSAATLEQSIQNINAALGGLDDSQLQHLSQTMITLGIDSVFSAQEVAGVGEALAKAGYTTEQITGGMTKAVIDLAAATGEGLEPAARGIIQALSIWDPALVGVENGMTDAARAADILTVAANNSQATVEEIIMGMRNLGPVAGQMGIGFDEAAAAIAMFTDFGMRGADAGVSLARGLENLATPTSEASQLMDELGIAAFDLEGNFIGFPELFRQLNAGMKGMSDETKLAGLSMIFGQEAADVMALAISAGADPLETMIALMEEHGVASNQAALRMDTLSGAFSQFREGISSMGASIMQFALDPLKELFKTLAGGLDAITKMPGPIRALGGAMLALVSSLVMLNAAFLIGQGVSLRWGAELRAISNIGGAVSKSMTGIGTTVRAMLGTFEYGLGRILPSITTLILLLGGIAAAVIIASAAINAIKNDFLGLGGAIDGVNKFIEGFRDHWRALFGETGAAAEEAADKIGAATNDIKGDVQNAVDDSGNPFWWVEDLDGKKIGDIVDSYILDPEENIAAIKVVGEDGEYWTTVDNDTGEVGVADIELRATYQDGQFPGDGTGGAKYIQEEVGKVQGIMESVAAGLDATGYEWASGIADGLRDAAPHAQSLADALSEAWSSGDQGKRVRELIASLPKPIQGVARGAAKLASEAGLMWRTLTGAGGPSQAMRQLPNFLRNVGVGFRQVFVGLGDVMRSLASNVSSQFRPLMLGLANTFVDVGHFAQNFFDTLSNFAAGNFGAALESLKNTMRSLGHVFDDLAGVFPSFGNLLRDLTDRFPLLENVGRNLESMFDNIGEAFGDFADAAREFAAGDFGAAFSSLGQGLADLWDAGIDLVQAVLWSIHDALNAINWDNVVEDIRNFADEMGEVPYVGWLVEAVLDGVAGAIDLVRNAWAAGERHWETIKDVFGFLADVGEGVGDAIGALAGQFEKLPQPLQDVATAARDAYVAMLLLQGVMMVRMGGGGLIGGLLRLMAGLALFPARVVARGLMGVLLPVRLMLRPLRAMYVAMGGVVGMLRFMLNPLRVFALGFRLAAAAIGLILSPISLAVAGLALLGVGLMTAYNTSESFRNAVNGLAGALVDIAGTVWDSISDALGRFGDAFRTARTLGADPFQAVIAGLIGMFPNLYDELINLSFASNDVKAAWNAFRAGDYEGMWESLGNAFGHVKDAFVEMASSTWDWVLDVGVPTITGWIADSANFTFDALQAAAGWVWDKRAEIGGVVLDVIGFLVTGAKSAYQAVKDWIFGKGFGESHGMGNQNTSFGSGWGYDIPEVAIRIVSWLVRTAARLASAIGTFVTDTAWPAAKGVLHSLGDVLLKIGGWAVRSWPSIWGFISGWITDLWDIAGSYTPISAGVDLAGWTKGEVLDPLMGFIDDWVHEQYTAGIESGELIKLQNVPVEIESYDVNDAEGVQINPPDNEAQIQRGREWGQVSAHGIYEGIVAGFDYVFGQGNTGESRQVADSMMGDGVYTSAPNGRMAWGDSLMGDINNTLNFVSGFLQGFSFQFIADFGARMGQGFENMAQPVVDGINNGREAIEGAWNDFQGWLDGIFGGGDGGMNYDNWGRYTDDDQRRFEEEGAVYPGPRRPTPQPLPEPILEPTPTGTPTSTPTGYAPTPAQIAATNLFNSAIRNMQTRFAALTPQQAAIVTQWSSLQAGTEAANRVMARIPFAPVQAGWRGVGTALNPVPQAAGLAANAFGDMPRIVAPATNQVVGTIGNMGSSVMGSTAGMAGSALGSVAGMATGTLGNFLSMRAGGVSEADALRLGATGSASGMETGVVGAVGGMAGSALSRFADMQRGGTRESQSMSSNARSNAQSMAGGVVTSAQNMAGRLIGEFVRGTGGVRGETGQWVGVVRSIGGAMEAAGQSAGYSASLGVAAGIRNGAGAAVSEARAMASAVNNAINSIIKPGSPSKVTTITGRSIPDGITQGIQQRTAAAIAAATAMTRGVVAALAPLDSATAMRDSMLSRSVPTAYRQSTPTGYSGTVAGASPQAAAGSAPGGTVNVFTLKSEELIRLMQNAENGGTFASQWSRPDALIRYTGR